MARVKAIRPRAKLVLRLGLAALVALVVFALGVRAWLFRDAEPVILARRTTVVSARESELVRSGNVTDQDVVVTGGNGLRAEYRARRKAESLPGERLPLLVLLGGHMRGKEATSFIPDPHGVIVVSLSYPFDGNERATGFAVAREVPAIRRALFDTPAAVMLALDHLLQRPDVDTTRIELVGASFGVPFAAIAGTLDPRVTRVWLVQGGGDPYSLLLAGLKDEIPWMPARKAVASLASTLASGPRLAPEAWVGRIAPRPVVMINTADDERIPRASAELLHSAARDPKEVVWLRGLHMQPNRPDVLGALIDAVFERIEAPGPQSGASKR